LAKAIVYLIQPTENFIFKIPGFFFRDVQNLSTKPTETGDRVDYAEIPRFLWWNGSIIGFIREETGDRKTACGKLKSQKNFDPCGRL